MRIILASPLYPPDIAQPAPYVKELAKRLVTAKSDATPDKITIVTYADIPEEIQGAEILCTSKQRPLLFRIIRYTILLAHSAKNADVIYAGNGASVELPIILISFVTRKPIIMHFSDTSAHEHAKRNIFYGSIERLASLRAKKIITELPNERPEILPFVPAPTEELESYETSWGKHLAKLRAVFKELSI